LLRILAKVHHLFGRERLGDLRRNPHVILHDVLDAFGAGKSGNSLGQGSNIILDRVNIAELKSFIGGLYFVRFSTDFLP
jgi:hypothetical protein